MPHNLHACTLKYAWEKSVIVCMHGGYLANQTCRVKLSHQNVTLTDNVNFDVCSLNA